MSSEGNMIRTMRRRRNYGLNMNLGQVLECIKDIMDELKENYNENDECAQWIFRTLIEVSASIRMHSLEEGILPASYPLSGDEDAEFKMKRTDYRARERDVEDLIKLVEDLPCMKNVLRGFEKKTS